MTDTTEAETVTGFCTRCDRLACVPLGEPEGLCPTCAYAEAADRWALTEYIARGDWRVR